MADNPHITTDLMTAIPAPLRRQVVSGMRWTFWLSVLAVPFSYGTSILLARIGPDVIGTYGLLMVYISVVSNLLYFGGDPVVIKFVPELPQEERLSFLGSYLFILIAFIVPWLLLAAAWPRGLHYLFGDQTSNAFQLLILYLSPLYILYSLIIAAHKAVLDMRTAQLMTRAVALGSFIAYAVLFFAARQTLAAHYSHWIWGTYLSITVLATITGTWHLWHIPEWRAGWRSLRWFLPRGFWTYTLATEQVSVASFLMGRLDFILILNFGGLTLLGQYVAMLTLAEIIRTGNRVLVETLLPSLTNSFAGKQRMAAAQLFSVNLRLLSLVDLLAIGVLFVFIDAILALLGPEYVPLRPLFLLMLLLGGLSAPAGIGGTLLSSIGKQQRAAWVCLGQLATFVMLFMVLWPRYHLAGAVLATGGSQALSALAFMAVATAGARDVVVRPTDYLKFLAIGLAAGLTAAASHSPAVALALWATAVGIFLWLANYTWMECRGMVYCFLPDPAENLLATENPGDKGTTQSGSAGPHPRSADDRRKRALAPAREPRDKAHDFPSEPKPGTSTQDRACLLPLTVRENAVLTTHQKNYDPIWLSRAVLLPGYIADYERFERMLPLRRQLVWGWKLFRLSRSFQAVITGSERLAYVFAVLQKLRRRKVPHIFMQSMWDVPSSRLQRLFRGALLRTIVSTASCVVVYSRRQLELYPRELGLPSEKLVFLHSHTSLYGKEYPVNRGDYVFAGGDSNRDYATLIAAARGLKCRVIIVTTQQMSTVGLPSNVEIIAGLPAERFNHMMAGAAAVAVPLHPGVLESGGRSVYGNAMTMGKAVIVADDDAGDYITDGHDGLVVPAGQPIALHRAIARVLADPELCTRLEQNAKQTARAFTPEIFFNALFAVADNCAATERSRITVAGH